MNSLTTHALVAVVADDLRATANRIAEALGYGPDNFSCAAGPSEDGPVTHWYLHAWATQAFVDQLTAEGGTIPDPADGRSWAEWGLTPADVEAALAAMRTQIDVLTDPARPADVAAFLTSLELMPVGG